MDKKKEIKKSSNPFLRVRTILDYPGGFLCKSGNGQAVPVYEKDDLGICKPKLDENGKPVFRNFYAEIQLFKDVNDYKRFLELNNGDVSVLEQAPASSYVDTTKFGSGVDVLNAAARVKESGLTLDQWMNAFKQYVADMSDKRNKELLKDHGKEIVLPKQEPKKDEGNNVKK